MFMPCDVVLFIFVAAPLGEAKRAVYGITLDVKTSMTLAETQAMLALRTRQLLELSNARCSCSSLEGMPVSSTTLGEQCLIRHTHFWVNTRENTLGPAVHKLKTSLHLCDFW